MFDPLRAELVPKTLMGTALWDWDASFFLLVNEDKPEILQGVESMEGLIKGLFFFFPVFFHICFLFPFSL